MINPIALKVLLEIAGKMTDKVSPKSTTKATLPLALSYLFYTSRKWTYLSANNSRQNLSSAPVHVPGA